MRAAFVASLVLFGLAASLARALGMEIELIPRKALTAVHAVVRGGNRAAKPAYSLEGEDEDDA